MSSMEVYSDEELAAMPTSKQVQALREGKTHVDQIRRVQGLPPFPPGLEKRTRSVLQDWVMDLPLREQGTLLTGIRGCDTVPKLPLDSTERQLVGFLRFCVCNPADPREVDIVGAFFQSLPPRRGWKASELGHHPQHWYSHIMHCFEVVAYRHPHPKIQDAAFQVYCKMVHSLHLHPETREEMIERLSEDRIASGAVVS